MMERQGKKSLATELRHRVDIQQATVTCDNDGGSSKSWSAVVSSVSAAVYPIRATQVWEYRSIGVHATHLIKLRGHVVVSEANRISWDGRTFEILTVENIQERDFVKVLTCKELR